jgi:hypothetical protein
MLELILSHWASYLFLAWIAVVAVAILWSMKKGDSPAQTVHKRPKRVVRERATNQILTEAEPIHPNR